MKKVYSHIRVSSYSNSSSELGIVFFHDVDEQTVYDAQGNPIDGFTSQMEIGLFNKHDGTSATINFGIITKEQFLAALIKDTKQVRFDRFNMELTFKTAYDAELNEFIGSCKEFPFIAFHHKNEVKALKGILKLTAKEVEKVVNKDAFWQGVLEASKK